MSLQRSGVLFFALHTSSDGPGVFGRKTQQAGGAPPPSLTNPYSCRDFTCSSSSIA